MRIACALVGILALGGCANSGNRQTYVSYAGDDSVCRGYGVQPGTDAYVACRMNLENNHAAQDMVAEQNRQRGYRSMMLLGASMMR